MTDIRDHLSPNSGPRRGSAAPSLVVIHHTAMASAEAALARLCDPAAEVSAHYLITESGEVVRLVPEELRAWHAGAGEWAGAGDVNSRSVGIELANPGPLEGSPPYAEAQMRALEALLPGIMARWGIAPEGVIAHSDMAPERKQDPGAKFDWRRLALGGLSVWLDPEPAEGAADAAAFQAAARRFGYPAPAGGAWCAATLAVLEAFRRRFLPADLGRAPDARAVAHMARLAARWPARLDSPGPAV